MDSELDMTNGYYPESGSDYYDDMDMDYYYDTDMDCYNEEEMEYYRETGMNQDGFYTSDRFSNMDTLGITLHIFFSIGLIALVGYLIYRLFKAIIRIIPEKKVMLIECFGKYTRTLKPGIRFIIPLIEKPRVINWDEQIYVQPAEKKTSGNEDEVPIPQENDTGSASFSSAASYYQKKYEELLAEKNKKKQKIKHANEPKQKKDRYRNVLMDLREKTYDYPSQSVITKDNVVMEVDAVIYYQIQDPVKAVYEVENLTRALGLLSQTTLRNVLGELDLDQCLTGRDQVNTKLQNVLNDAATKWGVTITRVELKDINPPEGIREEMERQMKAERERRANVLLAEGEKEASILKAEGYRQATVLRAKGNKEAKMLEAEGSAAEVKKLQTTLPNNSEAKEYLIAMKYIEALKQTAEGDKAKVVSLPVESSSVLASIGSIKSMFGDKNA